MAAVLRPSSAHRWGPGGCPGSPAMEARYPEPDSPEAMQGTAAHHYVTEALQGRVHPVTTLAPNGYPLDAEMVECGQSLLDDVRKEMAASMPLLGGPVLSVEQPLTMHLSVHPDNEGTPDVTLYDQAGWRVVIWDYKYGHRNVPVYENWQLINYFAGVIERLNLSFDQITTLKVSLRVVSPRNYSESDPVHRWDTTGGVLADYVRQLREAAKEARQEGAPCRTGPHCRDCNAAHACPALQAVGAYVVDMAGQSVPHELNPKALGMTLAKLEAAQARLKTLMEGLTADAQARIRAGRSVPGWRMGHGGARERWTVPPETVIATASLLGINVAKPTDLLTPKQARDAGLDEAIVASFSERPTGAAKLVPVTAADAARAFPQPQ